MKPPRGKRRDDPLVPIRGDRVRDALKRSAWSVMQLHRRTGPTEQTRVKQQTLDLIVHGKQLRCARSTRAKIAKALATPVAVLGGEEADFLPAAFRESYERDLAETPIEQRMFWLAAVEAGTRDQLTVGSDGFPGGVWELAQPEHWRRALLTVAPGHEREIMELEDLSSRERDRLRAMLADVMALLLKPWFEGRARLKLGRNLAGPGRRGVN